jgi:hypothetical protein
VGRVSGLLIPSNPPKTESRPDSKTTPDTKAADKKAAPPAAKPQQRPLHPSGIY